MKTKKTLLVLLACLLLIQVFPINQNLPEAKPSETFKMIAKGLMPLKSYLKLHPEARMEEVEQKLLLAWLNAQVERLEYAGNMLDINPGTQSSPDTCDDNDANPRCCFVQMPEKIGPELQIAPANEPGPQILIQGQFFKKDGKTPYPNVLVYVYQTDQTGRYTKKGDETGILRWHGRLHAWGRTDAQGRYLIRSVQPAAYPGRSTPAHIHAVIWEPGTGEEPYYIEDFLFAGDPLLSPAEHKEPDTKGVFSAVVRLQKNKNGLLEGRRDIVVK